MSPSQESHADWEDVDVDPDPERDLGYEGEEWDVIAVDQRGDEHVVFLPPEEDDAWEEEFIVAETEFLCDLAEMR